MIQVFVQAAAAAPAPKAFPEASIVRVRAQDGIPGTARSSSGVVIEPGLIATSAHGVAGCHALRVHQGDRSWPATLVRLDAARDLALLRVFACPLPPATLADPASIAEGDPVFSLGHPGGGPLARHGGRILAVWKYKGAALYQADALTEPGSSGGGLFDAGGRLVGFTTFVFPESPGRSFAVPAAWARELSRETELPDSEALDPRGLIRGFVSSMAEEVENWRAWERYCRGWVKEHPEDPSAWLALGNALDRAWEEGKASGEARPDELHLESIAAYQRAVGLQGGHAKAWNNLGVVLDTDNRFTEAEQAFLEALRLSPGYGSAWLNLGSCRMNQRRYTQAIEALQKGLALLPDEGRAWSRLGFCCLEAKRWPEAVAALRVAVRYAPHRRELWSELATAAKRAGDPAAQEEADAGLKTWGKHR